MSKRQSAFGRGFLYGLYQKKLRRQLEGQQLPRHVAMIIDGNRRWAKLKDLETAAHGHRAGAAKYREFLVWCDDLDISVATLYLLSTDNLTGRSPEELTELFTIIGDLAEDLSHFRDWRVQHVGSDAGLPEQLKSQLKAAHERTASNTGLHVNLAIGYHSDEGHSLEALAELLTPELIGEHLYTKGQPDPDLVIRTSGEQRISDFMLWQSAHSELYFMEALGPDLREVDFLRALRDFSRRNRRFGA